MSATKICPECGGMGGEPGSNFGDHGWHPCYLCGESGRVPADYCPHNNLAPVLEGAGEYDRFVWHENGFEVLYRCPDCQYECHLRPPPPPYMIREQD